MTEKEKPKKISLIEKWNNQMALIKEKTGIRGIYVVIALILSVFFVYLNVFDTIITNLVGTLYPAFWTIKSIETNNLKDQKNWLTYWAVFGFFILVDMFSPIIIKFIPFYFVFKIIFLIWLFMPGSSGCTIIYNLVVKKILRKYEDELDNAVNKIKVVINENNIEQEKKNNKKLNKLKFNGEMSMAEAVKYAKEIEEKGKAKEKEHSE